MNNITIDIDQTEGQEGQVAQIVEPVIEELEPLTRKEFVMCCCGIIFFSLFIILLIMWINHHEEGSWVVLNNEGDKMRCWDKPWDKVECEYIH